MHKMNQKQLVLLALLTLTWGINWPIMKLGVTDYPPLTFRTISMWLGLPVLGLGLVVLKVPFRIARRDWPELVKLGALNMFIWHVTIIIAIKHLSSGRAAILGYTMPIFSAVIGAWFFKSRLSRRAWVGVSAAALGVVLLLWHELTHLAGRPWAVGLALLAASTWAVGTQMLRRTRIEAPTLAISFWMTVMTAVIMAVLAITFERPQWKAPSDVTWASIAFNAVLIFGFAQAVWLVLARDLPPVASTLSVMFIPVLGVFSGALWLGEVLHWQDFVAIALMVVAIASVLWPARTPAATP